MTHRPNLRLHGVGGHQLKLVITFGVLEGKVNSAHYIAKVVNPVLLSILEQEGDVLFQQDNVCPHMDAVTQCALCGVQQLPWSAKSPDFSPVEHVWDMMKRKLILPQSLPQPLLNCDRGCKNT